MSAPWWAEPPAEARCAGLLATATEACAELAGELAALDVSLRQGERHAVDRLLACFDAVASASDEGPARQLRHNFCALWGLAAMPIAPGQRADALPPAWLEALPEAGEASVAAVERAGVLAGPEQLVLRPAWVRFGEAAPPAPADIASPPPAAEAPPRREANKALIEALAAYYNAHQLAPEATRDLKLALAGEHVGGDEAAADALCAWLAATSEAASPPPPALAAGLQERLTALLASLAEAGLELFPWPPTADEALAELQARWGGDSIQYRRRWSSAPADALLCVERFGRRRSGALEQPARVWLSRGTKPVLVDRGERALAALTALPDGAAIAEPCARFVDELASAEAEARVRGLVGLLNAVDQQVAIDESTRPALDPSCGELLVALADHGVEELALRPGEAFDRHPPDLYHVRRAQSPTARQGEILRVLRRALRAGDGRLIQQAMLEVNLGS